MTDWSSAISGIMLESCISLEPGLFEYEDQAFLDIGSPLWILGARYDNPRKDVQRIKDHLSSLLWFTYRKGFQAIGGTGPTSDQGWGCMLRCGQMLMAQAMIARHLGREWLWRQDQRNPVYMNILRMFQDKKHRLFSLQQIAQMGVSEGREVGQWFAPNNVAQVLKKLSIYDNWSSLAVYVALNNLVVIEDIHKLCTTRPPASRTQPAEQTNAADANEWRPLLLVVPLRPGLTSLNDCYRKAICEFFALPSCVGMIGGRPNHALYFVGVAGDELLYLDPHCCQETVDADVPTAELDDGSFHCPFVMHLPLANIDPSLALGFLCTTAADCEQLYRDLRHVRPPSASGHAPPLQRLLRASEPPLFEVQQTHPDWLPPFVPYTGESTPPLRGRAVPSTRCTQSLSEFTVVDDVHYDSDDDFEVLG